MLKEKVRCWKVIFQHGSKIEHLYVTYPEGNYGYMLVSCLNCGKVYSVNSTKELYLGPSLKDKLETVDCQDCGVKLSEHYSVYPDRFLGSDGRIYKYNKDNEMPSD